MPPPTESRSFADSAAEYYNAVVEGELREESNRKASLEQRGLAVISTAGVLTALLFAILTAVVGPAGSQTPNRAIRILLVAALLVFVAAAVAGLVAASPTKYWELKASFLYSLVQDGEKGQFWNEPKTLAVWRVTQARIQLLDRARKINSRKGQLLFGAFLGEVLGVAVVASAIVVWLAPY